MAMRRGMALARIAGHLAAALAVNRGYIDDAGLIDVRRVATDAVAIAQAIVAEVDRTTDVRARLAWAQTQRAAFSPRRHSADAPMTPAEREAFFADLGRP